MAVMKVFYSTEVKNVFATKQEAEFADMLAFIQRRHKEEAHKEQKERIENIQKSVMTGLDAISSILGLSLEELLEECSK